MGAFPAMNLGRPDDANSSPLAGVADALSGERELLAGGGRRCLCGGDYNVFFSSRRRHTRYWRDWSSDVCSSDLAKRGLALSIDHLPLNYPQRGQLVFQTRNALIRSHHQHAPRVAKVGGAVGSVCISSLRPRHGVAARLDVSKTEVTLCIGGGRQPFPLAHRAKSEMHFRDWLAGYRVQDSACQASVLGRYGLAAQQRLQSSFFRQSASSK